MNNSLFYKLSGSLLVILIILGSIMGKLGYDSSIEHHHEANQRLNKDLAQFTADHVVTFDSLGQVNESALNDIMHSMMVINPDVEVYLVDHEGEILKHVAPKKKVLRTKVDLAPIKQFISEGLNGCIEGDDPRSESGKKIFSAAPIIKDGETLAYYYIILASQEKASMLESLKSHIALSYWMKTSIVAFLMAFVIGLILLWRFTKNLKPIESSMMAFQNGDLDARIEENTGDFKAIANAYNSMANEIQQSFEKIKSVDQFRKEFIANISHDLRSPLVVMKGYAETLQLKGQELDNKTRDKYLEYIIESSKQTEGLLNQLLELSKLENNQIELKKEVFDLKELISDLMARFDLILERKSIRLVFESSESNSMILGDISLIERAIQNLIDNAVKYSPENSEIKIQIHGDADHVHFTIKNEGEGIEEAKLSRIFQRYESGQKDSAGKSMGLGLAIVKKIAELHNAQINVRSKLNEGASFTLQLHTA
ncbi:MAG: HAMP domain-containing sensor histidine kinase [Bacteroidota bacterium]